MSIDVKFDSLHHEVMKQLEMARKSVSIAVAWVTFKLYEEVFKKLIDNGVTVNICCTNSSPNQKQELLIKELREYGVTIRLCEMPQSKNHMHHKFAIIDESVILNGSFNWSENAVKSFENLMIIKNEPKVVSSFISEFEKIEQLDKKAIKSLQAVNKCKRKDYGGKNCDGKVVNLLVFQPSSMSMTYEIWGDVIQSCAVCGEDDFNKLHRGVQDTQLHSLLSTDTADFDDEESLLFDRQVDSYLTGYSQREVIIHGIGFVSREMFGRNEEFIFTKIVWKNKFVADSVGDKYETDFGVSYE